MRKRIFIVVVLSLLFALLTGCSELNLSSSSSSTFGITFIDVGQGDSALVECDGQFMLIDGGDTNAGDKVYSVLEERGIQHLDVLAISHLHADHIGGLIKALTYATKIDKTISNSDYSEKDTFRKLEHQLAINGAHITVPREGQKYKLGSAEIEVVYAASESENDSLVLLITYKNTRFLFTGDIGDNAQTYISDKYENPKDKENKINLIKMPHHGSCSQKSVDGTGSLYRFIRTFMPDYGVISVGKGNEYGHPHRKTLELLEDADIQVFRTDWNGDITVKSDGNKLEIETSK